MIFRAMKFWNWNQLVLMLSLVLLSSQSSHALDLHFGEDDFSEKEGNGKLKAVVVAGGEFTGSITVQVLPMTVLQFQSQGLTPLPHTLNLNDPNLDQAKAGADFNNEVQYCILEGGHGHTIDKDVYIDIIDDDISEHPEVFLLVLRVVNATEGLEIEMTRNVSVARIRQDMDASKTKVSFNGSVLNVNEGAGLLNDTLFIEIKGVAEPTLFVQLSMQGPLGESDSDDIHLLKSVISIPSGAKRVPVSLEIIDDVIVEELYETIRINIAPTDGQQSLFSTGQNGTVKITIRDNDRAHFGFEVTSLRTGNSSRQLLEGEAAEVCVLLLEPEEFTTDVIMTVELSSDSVPLLTIDDLGPIPNERQYYFASDSLKHCFNITANENEDINEPNTATFTMAADPTALLWPESVERIDMDNLHIVILDNDGIPKAPSNIKLSLTNDGQDLLVTWTSENSKLQPITQYRVSVRTVDVDDSKSVDVRSRRQSDVEVKEYVTPEERLLLEDVEGGKTYTIQVCAENNLGHTCANPEVVSITIGKDGKPRTLVLISDGLGDAESSTAVSTLPQEYIIVTILLPCILFLAVCILVISVIICSRSRYNSKNYYPSQQEKRMEKQIEAMEGRFHTRSLSAGSLNSTTSSASEFTRV